MEIVKLEPKSKTTKTAEGAIANAVEWGFKDILIVGYDEDGGYMTCSSSMSNADALFLMEILRKRIMSEIE